MASSGVTVHRFLQCDVCGRRSDTTQHTQDEGCDPGAGGRCWGRYRLVGTGGRAQRITQPMHPVQGNSGSSQGTGSAQSTPSTSGMTQASRSSLKSLDEWCGDTIELPVLKKKCECGAEKCGTTHSFWCPKHRELKDVEGKK